MRCVGAETLHSEFFILVVTDLAFITFSSPPAARDFVQSLDNDTVENWDSLEKALVDRFPYFQPKEDEGEVIIRVQALKQGSRALSEYIDESRQLHGKLHKANHLLLCKRWVRGLANSDARVTLLQRMQEWKSPPDTIPFGEFITTGKFYRLCRGGRGRERVHLQYGTG